MNLSEKAKFLVLYSFPMHFLHRRTYNNNFIYIYILFLYFIKSTKTEVTKTYLERFGDRMYSHYNKLKFLLRKIYARYRFILLQRKIFLFFFFRLNTKRIEINQTTFIYCYHLINLT